MRRWILMTAIAVAVPLACGDDTGRSRTTFDVDVAGVGSASTNDHGWSVELTRAEMRLGELAFYEGEPLFSWRDLVGIRSAFAHPGHYMEGDALAELLDAKDFDLLADVPVVYGTANGVTGDYNSAEVRVERVTIEGTATKGDRVVTFSADVALDADVVGIAFGAPVRRTSGRVELRVDLATWLARADFADAEDGVLVPESQPHRALLRGLVNTSSFLFERKETP